MAEYLASKVQRRDPRVGQARAAEAERLDTYTELPAEIVAFDAASQTATVKVLHKPRLNGEAVDFPDLQEVPVAQIRGGGGFGITLPIKAGDRGTVRFMSRSLENAYLKGEAGEAAQDRAGDLSDGVFHPGGFGAAADAYGDYDGENATFRGPGGALTMAPSGKLAIEGAGEDLVTILFDLIEALRISEDVEGPGFNPAARAALAALKARVNMLKLR